MVLADIDARAMDAVWCLGDVVGYGPAPNECCAVVRERADLCLVGNHDLAVLGSVDVGDFNLEAALATTWTQKVLDDEARTFLEALESSGRAEGAELFHGSPVDPVWDYVLSGEGARASFRRTTDPLVLVGHSHVPLAFSLAGDELAGGHTPGGTELDLAAGRWLLNPGSVGQPRDGDPRAAWLLLDLGARQAEFIRLEYPVARTQRAMRRHGLPKGLAERLAHGL